MSKQGWVELISGMKAAGTLLNTYTTAKSVINPTELIKLPANYIDIGRKLRVKAWGALSNIVTTPGLVVFQIMLGSTVIFTTGNIQLNATAHVLLPFRFEATLTCRAVGSGTNANCMGMAEVAGVHFTATAGQVDGVNSQSILQAPATAPAVGGGFDSTIDNILDFWAGWTINNAGNGIQLQDYSVEALN